MGVSVEPNLDAPETPAAVGVQDQNQEPKFTLSEVDLKALIVTSFEEGYKTGRQMRFKKEVLEDVMHTFAARLVQIRPWEASFVIAPPANEESEPDAPPAPKRVRPDTPETSL